MKNNNPNPNPNPNLNINKNFVVAFHFESNEDISSFTNDSISTDREDGHPFNRDDQNYYYRKLYSDLLDMGAEVDIYKNLLKRNIQPSHIIFFDIPSRLKFLKNPAFLNVVKIVYLSECKMIKPWNFRKSNFQLFDYILTWSEDVLKDTNNSIKINNHFCYTDYNLSDFNKYHSIKPKKLCVLISSNKNSTHPLELYSLRKSVLEWFEENKPEHFHLYGYDWDKRYIRSPKVLKILNRFKFYTHRSSRIYTSYQGESESKIKTMANYKFSICFENAKSNQGYLTEKIFDSMISGSIPIYFGDPNVEQNIPSSCYVKYENFSSIGELFEYMTNISDEEYNKYIESIRKFLTGNDINKFSASNFSKTFINIISKTLS